MFDECALCAALSGPCGQCEATSDVYGWVARARADLRAALSAQSDVHARRAANVLALVGAAVAPIVPLLCARQLVEAPIIPRPGRLQ